MENESLALAEHYFCGAYGGDLTVLEALTASEIVAAYPVFKELFGRPAQHGREAIKEFATTFGERWTEA